MAAKTHLRIGLAMLDAGPAVAQGIDNFVLVIADAGDDAQPGYHHTPTRTQHYADSGALENRPTFRSVAS